MADGVFDITTASRHTLSEEWEASRSALDWMHVPGMPEYVNGLVSGKAMENGGHWALHCLERHISTMAKRLGRPLDMVALGCGDAHIEASLIEQFGWPIRSILCLERDSALRSAAQERLEQLNVSSEVDFFDFNHAFDIGTFDIVFCCHSIHHATDIETFLCSLNGLMRDDSLLIGIDYFGPSRFQVAPEAREIIQALYDILPQHLKLDVTNPAAAPPAVFPFTSIKTVRNADISEAPRSSDLRAMLLANFPAIEIKPMGGTLLRWLYENRAGNFDHSNVEHRAIARLTQMIERTMIEERRIQSDDLFFVLGKAQTEF